MRLGRPPDTSCIQGLGSRRCGPCTWSSSPGGTAERWGWTQGLLRQRGLLPTFPPILTILGNPKCSAPRGPHLVLFQCQGPLLLCPPPQGPHSSSPEPGNQHLSSRGPRDSQCLSQEPPTFSLTCGNHATLSLSPQYSRPGQTPGTQREAPCKPSNPHGAGHCTHQPPAGHCHQARLPRVSTDHSEVLLGLEECRSLGHGAPKPPTTFMAPLPRLPPLALLSLSPDS